jgi:hypothetical protein
MIAQILDVIPTDSMKTQATDLINKCGKKGNTTDNSQIILCMNYAG